jgi:hypothetical protein
LAHWYSAANHSVLQGFCVAAFEDFIRSIPAANDGKAFEVFVKWFLKNDPEWATQVDDIWLCVLEHPKFALNIALLVRHANFLHPKSGNLQEVSRESLHIYNSEDNQIQL